MDRRESIKSLLIGGMTGAALGTAACTTSEKNIVEDIKQEKLYGRLPHEILHDQTIMDIQFYTEPELNAIAVLCDIILPATDTAGSATDAGVPEFIEFISKDLPAHQIPLRGGLMWLNGESNKRFDKIFTACTVAQQIEIVDDIAYPDDKNEKPEFGPGRSFFNRMRNLTLTAYYTTKMGMDDLGYKGNIPNVWDGVPQDVLDKHNLAYDEKWLHQYVDQDKRDVQAEWDDQGKLLT